MYLYFYICRFLNVYIYGADQPLGALAVWMPDRLVAWLVCGCWSVADGLVAERWVARGAGLGCDCNMTRSTLGEVGGYKDTYNETYQCL